MAKTVLETNRNKLVARLVREGWTLARRGSEHDVFTNSNRAGFAIVPRHRTLSPGVARKIARIAGWI